MEVRTRFAPSPTGFMHLGNLRTALYTWLWARHSGGKFILRIEDTDQQRLVEGAVDLMYRSLKIAGLDWDEGPDVGGPCGPYVQTERKSMYLPYAKQLVEQGDAYYCFCSKERLDTLRTEAEAKGETFKYDKCCLQLSKEEVQRRLDAGEEYVIRQNIPETGTTGFDDVLFGHIEVENSTLDDNVLIKSDGLPTYNFANVIDDHTMGITHIMRGTEYLSSTPKYNLLYDAFGWEKPTYIHLSTIMADAQRKLSKRKGDPSFEDLLNMGYIVPAVVNYVALLGWNPGTEQEKFTLDELVNAFSLEGLSKSPAIFDMEKLRWFNAEYIRAMEPEAFHQLVTPYIEKEIGTGFDSFRLAQLLQPRCEVLPDVQEKISFLKELPDYDLALYENKRQKTNAQTSLEMLEMLLPILEAIPEFTEDAIRDAVSQFIADQGLKNGPVLWPLRIALSGKEATPGGAYEIGYLLGKDESLRRIRLAMEKLKA